MTTPITDFARQTPKSIRPAHQIIMLIVFIGVCFLVAATGSAFPPDEWYASLNRPAYSPPNWVFGPVWTLLYLMMAVAAWLVWRTAGFDSARRAFFIFGLQLILNAGWSGLFFGLHRPDLAFAEILLLWVAIAATCIAFWRHSTLAAALLVPYLCWVTFAAVLNYGFWSLNA